MNLLVFAPYFPPRINAQSIQADRVVAALRESGLNVRVVGDQSDAMRPVGIVAKIYRKLDIAIRRLGGHLGFPRIATPGAIESASASMKDGWRPDCILSISTPFEAHITGSHYASVLGVPWVAFLSDPWPLDICPPPYGREKLTLLGRLDVRLARRTLRTAAVVISPTREALALLQDKGIIREDQQGPETLHCSIPSPEDAGGLTVEPGLPRRIAHIGEVSAQRSSVALLEAIRLIAPELRKRNVTVEFVGNVAQPFKVAAQDLVAEGYIVFKGSVSPAEAVAEASRATALLLIEAKMECSPFLPSKIVDYVSSARPILAISDVRSAMRRILNNVEGVVFSEDAASSISHAMMAVLDGPASAPTCGTRELFSQRSIAGRYLVALERAVAATKNDAT